MQFKVPQFIDIEDKLFGPFTFKQFAYMAGGAGIIFTIYKLIPLLIGIFFIIPVAIFSILLTFYKINGKPFAHYLQAGMQYFLSSRLYIWKQYPEKNEDFKKENLSQVKEKTLQDNGNRSIRDVSRQLDLSKK